MSQSGALVLLRLGHDVIHILNEDQVECRHESALNED